MIEKLRRHWQTLTITILLLLVLSPSPIALPFIHPVQTARAALKAGNLEMTKLQLENAIGFEPALTGLHLVVADLAFAVGDLDSAKAHLNALAVNGAQNNEVYCLRQQVTIRAGNLAVADFDWGDLIVDCPEAIPAIQQLALDWLTSIGLEESLPILEALASASVHNNETEEAYAYAMAALSPEESLPLLHALARKADQTPTLALDLILAIDDSTDAQSPGLIQAQMGQTFARHGRWNLAIPSLERALELNPDFHMARAYLGLSKDQAGQNGLDDLRIAADAMPDQALTFTFLALHWLNAGEEELAGEALTTAAQIDPQNPAIAAQLGEFYAGLGDFTTAAAAYRQAASLDPKNPEFWLLLASFSNQYEVDLRSLALPAARNAVALSTREATPLTELAYTHFLLGNNILAERLLWKAVALNPKHAQTQYYLGLYLDSIGDRSGAWAAMWLASSLDAPNRYQALAERWLTGVAR